MDEEKKDQVEETAEAAAGKTVADVEAAAGEAEAEPAKPAKRKMSKQKRTGIMVAVVAAVAIAAAGMWVWHEQPSFCNAFCHTPMDGYLTTFNEELGTEGVDKWGNKVSDTSSMLATVHASHEGTNCISCHVPTIGEQVSEGIKWLTGNYEVVQSKDLHFTPTEKSLSDLTAARGIDGEQFCLNSSCHNMTREELAEKTSSMTRNPHVEQHGEVQCSECHKAHRASTNYCSKCHADAEIPEGWVSYTEYEAAGPVEYSE